MSMTRKLLPVLQSGADISVCVILMLPFSCVNVFELHYGVHHEVWLFDALG